MFVLKELLDTEKEYVEKMNDLIKVGVAGSLMPLAKWYTCRDSSLKCPVVICLSHCSTRNGLCLVILRICTPFTATLLSHDLQSANVHETIAQCFINYVSVTHCNSGSSKIIVW